jgi:hypothetical protein
VIEEGTGFSLMINFMLVFSVFLIAYRVFVTSRHNDDD